MNNLENKSLAKLETPFRNYRGTDLLGGGAFSRAFYGSSVRGRSTDQLYREQVIRY